MVGGFSGLVSGLFGRAPLYLERHLARAVLSICGEAVASDGESIILQRDVLNR